MTMTYNLYSSLFQLFFFVFFLLFYSICICLSALYMLLLFIFFFFFFFFSSRRRHTRLVSDWSSDVCSSDLNSVFQRGAPGTENGIAVFQTQCVACHGNPNVERAPSPATIREMSPERKIGRASCRERVEISGVAVSVKKKKRKNSRSV